MPPSGLPRSRFDEFRVWVKGSVDLLRLTGGLRSTYERFRHVESIAFLHESFVNWRGPRCLDYLGRNTLWRTCGANLRELNISITGYLALPAMLPADDCHISLPRLEVMRFAYTRNVLSQEYLECPVLGIIAQLYASATATLHTLELRFDVYARHSPPIAGTLLRNGVVFNRMRHFAFKLKQLSSLVVEDDIRNVARFISDHSNTLRNLQLGELPTVVDALVDDTVTHKTVRMIGAPAIFHVYLRKYLR